MAEYTYGPFTEQEARATTAEIERRGFEAYAVPDHGAVWYVWTTYEATPAERGETQPEHETCPHCGQETGDTPSLTQWPQHTHCPHCGADLVPF
jgi:ribosomal protein S27AE